MDAQSRRGRGSCWWPGRTAELPAGAPPAGRPVALVAIEEQVRANARATLGYFAHQGVAVKVMSGDDPARWGGGRVGIPGAGEPVDPRRLPDDPEELRLGGGQHRARSHRAPAEAGHDPGAAVPGHTVSMTGDEVTTCSPSRRWTWAWPWGLGAVASRGVRGAARLGLRGARRRCWPRAGGSSPTSSGWPTCSSRRCTPRCWPWWWPGCRSRSCRHLTIISSLTIGIPAFFLALAPNDRRARPGFVGRVLRFAVPAGVLAATATMVSYGLARAEHVPATEARTTAAITLFIVALWVLAILARPTDLWRSSWRRPW